MYQYHFYRTFIESWNKSWFQFFFLFTDIAKLIRRPDVTPWDFLNTYQDSSRLTRRWIRYCLGYALDSFDELLKGVEFLKVHNLYNRDNINAFVKYYKSEFISLLRVLDSNQLLNQANFEILIQNKLDVEKQFFIVQELSKKRLLNQNTFNLFKVSCIDVIRLYNVVCFLNNKNDLTEKNLMIYSAQYSYKELYELLQWINKSSIASPQNEESIIKHGAGAYSEIRSIIKILEKNKLLTQENFDLILPIINRGLGAGLIDALTKLEKNKLLTQETFEFLKSAGDHFKPTEHVASYYYQQWSDLICLFSEKEYLTPESYLFLSGFKNPDILFDILRLYKIFAPWLLSFENFKKIAEHPKYYLLASIFSLFSRMELISQDSFNLIIEAQNIDDLVYVFRKLNELGYNPCKYVKNIFIHKNLIALNQSLISIQVIKNINHAIIDNILVHDNPRELTDIFIALNSVNMLTPENIELSRTHNDISNLHTAILLLNQVEMLTDDNFKLVASHQNLVYLIAAIHYLNQANLLSEDKLKLIASHPNTLSLALLINLFLKKNILTDENFNLLISHPAPDILYQVLNKYRDAFILTEENFKALLLAENAALISEQALIIWNRLPPRLLTEVNYQRILRASEQSLPLIAFEQVINQIIAEDLFVAPQSTHTASVHRSVSESARRLFQHYYHDIQLEEIIEKLKTDVNRFSDTPKHEAAKRCIARLTSWEITFTDPISQVSILQLLALVYYGIHDHNRRKDPSGTPVMLEDAMALLIDGLYEIQRGYNINSMGVDIGGGDQFICAAGTFNKLIEKLNGIHQDVQLVYITHAGALFKFPKLVTVHVLNYLKNLSSPKSIDDFLKAHALLEDLKENQCIEPIWDALKEGIRQAFWEEFAEAYANDQDEKFTALLNAGQYVALPNLGEIEKELLASEGAQSFVNQQMRSSLKEQSLLFSLERQSMWKNRHDSPQHQRAFDMQFGLVVS